MGRSRLYTRHAQDRIVERYNRSVNKDLARQIIGQIQNGLGTFVKRTSNTRTVWEIEAEGTLFRVAYSTKHKKIITFLHPHGENDDEGEGVNPDED